MKMEPPKFKKMRVNTEIREILIPEAPRDSFHQNSSVSPFALRKRPSGKMIPYYAKDANGIPKYPFDQDGIPKFLVKEDGTQMYAKINNKQLYPEFSGHQTYAKNKTGDEYPAVDEKLEPYYAKTMDEQQHVVEYPFTMASGEKRFIIVSGKFKKYPFDFTENRPKYDKNQQGDEIYFRDETDCEMYATDDENNQFYTKDKHGNECIARDSNNKPYYANRHGGDEFYPKMANGDEYYLRNKNVEIHAQLADESGFYAKNKAGDEMYPKIFQV